VNQTIGYLRWADKDPMIAGLDAWSMDGMVDAHGTMHLPKLFDCCACPPNFSLSLSLARASLGSAAKWPTMLTRELHADATLGKQLGGGTLPPPLAAMQRS
jgi:hypothetical protein